MKLVLGTAQFGMDYGINNDIGRLPKDDVFAILGLAKESGIEVIDTAFDYEESEAVLGDFFKDHKDSFKVISKLPACTREKVRIFFDSSLKRLGVDYLYAYLIHLFDAYQKDMGIWEELKRLRGDKLVSKIGFSLYYPFELELLLSEKVSFDIIQIPYNIFDRRFEKYFPVLRRDGVEIHVRSVFLQGLFFKDTNKLSSGFADVKNKLTRLHGLSQDTGIPEQALCLTFATMNDFIDKVIIGVDTKKQLKSNIDALRYEDRVRTIQGELFSFKEDNEDVLVPSRWKL